MPDDDRPGGGFRLRPDGREAGKCGRADKGREGEYLQRVSILSRLSGRSRQRGSLARSGHDPLL